MITLSDFMVEYTGVANVGDTAENTGECVGLVESYLDELGTDYHIWGNAKDLIVNASPLVYDITTNGPFNYPEPGDIVCFDGYYGNGNGHTGIAVSATENSMVLFEQNDPEGSTPHLEVYNYDHCIGWIHPKILDNQPNDQGASEVPISDDEVKDLYRIFLKREPVNNEEASWVGMSWHDAFYGIKDSLEAQAIGAAPHPDDVTPTPVATVPTGSPAVPQTPVAQATEPSTDAPVIPRVDSLSKLPQPVLVQIADTEQQAANWLGTTLGGIFLKLLGALTGWLLAKYQVVPGNDVAASVIGLVLGSGVHTANTKK